MFKKYRKVFITIFLLGLLLFILKTIAPFFYSGAYPFSAIYEIDVKESLLKQKIKEFKENNPSYNTPEQCELTDHTDQSYNNLFRVYFYYKKENKIVTIWVSSGNKNKSELGVVAINNGLDIGNWRTLNSDLDEDETQEELSLFENRILKQLGLPYKKE